MKDEKQPFRFISVRKDQLLDANEKPTFSVRYEASFWEGPIEPGQSGRYVRRICDDTIINGKFLNTSPSVSYYTDLCRKCAKELKASK